MNGGGSLRQTRKNLCTCISLLASLIDIVSSFRVLYMQYKILIRNVDTRVYILYIRDDSFPNDPLINFSIHRRNRFYIVNNSTQYSSMIRLLVLHTDTYIENTIPNDRRPFLRFYIANAVLL